LPPGRDYSVVAAAAVHHLHHSVLNNKEELMPRGDKSKYTEKEKRQAEHIEEGYEKRGVPEDEAERRAWATVNAVHGGGEKPGGGGYGKPENHAPMRKGGRNSHKGKSR
jgi:plasmid stabilization system protein ParE